MDTINDRVDPLCCDHCFSLLCKKSIRFRLFVWSSVSFMISLAPPLNTEYGAPFYMPVPGMYAIGGYVLFWLVLDQCNSRAKQVIVGAAISGIAVLHLWNFSARMEPYERFIVQSENFRQALSVMAWIGRDATRPFLLVYPKVNFIRYMFLDQGQLSRYIFGDDEHAATFNRGYSWGTFEKESADIPANGAIKVVFDEDMKLKAIEP